MASTPLTAAPERLDDEVISFAADLFSALAHPTRLRIVELLTASERTVNEIAHELDILQPNTSQHLAILQRAGVVRVTPRGALRSYSIRAPRMSQILTLVEELRSGQACDEQSRLLRDGNGRGNGHRLTMRDGHAASGGNGNGNGAGRDGDSIGVRPRTLHARHDGERDGHNRGDGSLRP